MEAKKNHKKRRVWPIIIIILLVIAALAAYVVMNLPSVKYNKAQKLYAAGDYAAAESVFAELGDYLDSKDRINACRFSEAQRLVEEGNLEEAIAAYTMLGEYKDSDSIADSLWDILLAEKYPDFVAQAAEADSDTAVKNFLQARENANIADMEDAYGTVGKNNNTKDLRLMMMKELAEFCEKQEEYILGTAWHEKIRALEGRQLEPLNAEEQECWYQAALQLEQEGSYIAASEHYEKLGEYNDSPARLNECNYQTAKLYMAEGEYESAIEIFNALDNECNEEKAECIAAWRKELVMRTYEYDKSPTESYHAKYILSFAQDLSEVYATMEIECSEWKLMGDVVFLGHRFALEDRFTTYTVTIPIQDIHEVEWKVEFKKCETGLVTSHVTMGLNGIDEVLGKARNGCEPYLGEWY